MRCEPRGAEAGPRVATVTVAVVGEDPFGVTLVLDRVQAPKGGAPAQLSATAALKPPKGVMVSV